MNEKKPTTGKYSHKDFKCRRCGNIESHGTNHWGSIYCHCKKCSWKNPMDSTPTWDCIEPMPEGYNKPEEWKKVKLGDLIETKEQTKERMVTELDKKAIELKDEYGESKNGNFFICDTIGVPHPYCIGAGHVGHASDHFNGMLGSEAIKSAERKGIKCATRGCNLSYEEHEQSLLVCCKEELNIEDKTNPELHEWLLSIKDKVESEKKYVGFSFIQYESWKSNQ